MESSNDFGIVVVATPNQTIALDGRQGTERWRNESPLSFMTSHYDIVLGIDSTHRLTAWDVQNGHNRWTSVDRLLTPDPPTVMPYLIVDDHIIIITAERALVSLDVAHGAIIWRTPPAEYVQILAGDAVQIFAYCELAAQGYGARGGALRVLDARHGMEQWHLLWPYTELTNWHREDPLPFALCAETVFLSHFTEDVLALRRHDGAEQWRYPLSTPIDCLHYWDVDWLCVGTNGQVFVLQAADGQVRWIYRDSREDVAVDAFPAQEVLRHVVNIVHADARMIVTITYMAGYHHSTGSAHQGHVVALARDGTQQWRLAWPHAIVSNDGIQVRAIPTSPHLVVASYGGIAVLDQANGQMLWRGDCQRLDYARQQQWLGEILFVNNEDRLLALDMVTDTIQWSMALPVMELTCAQMAFLSGSKPLRH